MTTQTKIARLKEQIQEISRDAEHFERRAAEAEARGEGEKAQAYRRSATAMRKRLSLLVR